MTAADLFSKPSKSELQLSGTVPLESSLVLNRSVQVTGDSTAVIAFAGGTLRFEGLGPFVFRGVRFEAQQETGTSPILIDNAQIFFEDCTFEGFSNEDSQVVAIRAKGRSKLEFIQCRFQDNDSHLQLENTASADLRQCHLETATTDAVRLLGCSYLKAEQCRFSDSGWTGLHLGERSRSHLDSCRLERNGEHGVHLSQKAELISCANLFANNGQHGLSLVELSTLVSTADRFTENELCGLDLGDESQALMRESRAEGNGSHGFQFRDSSRARLDRLLGCENRGSGLAVFALARVQAEQYQGISNGLNGAQCGDEGRLGLLGCSLKNNLSSGLALFGQGRTHLEDTRLLDNQGYGAQVIESHQVSAQDCGFQGNSRGGLLLLAKSRGRLDSCELKGNGLHGIAVGDLARLTLSQSQVRENSRDGVLLHSKASSELIGNQFLQNGRYGFFAAVDSRPLWADNESRDNLEEQTVLETAKARQASSQGTFEQSIAPMPEGVTLCTEGGQELHLPFQPKKVEKKLLEALLRHGRLSEAALGKAAESRRVGGAMENLIDRLSRAGLPLIRHDGDGPEGNVYALRLDLSRKKIEPGQGPHEIANLGRNVC